METKYHCISDTGARHRQPHSQIPSPHLAHTSVSSLKADPSWWSTPGGKSRAAPDTAKATAVQIGGVGRWHGLSRRGLSESSATVHVGLSASTGRELPSGEWVLELRTGATYKQFSHSHCREAQGGATNPGPGHTDSVGGLSSEGSGLSEHSGWTPGHYGKKGCCKPDSPLSPPTLAPQPSNL